METVEPVAPVEVEVVAAPVAPKIEFSQALPFLKKPKNLDGMVVSSCALK